MPLIHTIDSLKFEPLLTVPLKGLVKYNKDPLKLGRVKVLIDEIFPTAAELLEISPDDQYDPLPWIFPESPSQQGGNTDAGSFAVPEVDSEVMVSFPYNDIYFGFYSGYWQGEGTHQGTFNEDYPNTYGQVDRRGLSWKVNKTRKTMEFSHPSGFRFYITEGGDAILEKLGGKLILQTPNGQTKISIDGDTGDINIEGPENLNITANINVDNASIVEKTGSRKETIDGDKTVETGGGMSETTGGSKIENVISNKSSTIAGDKTSIVGGTDSKTIGLGSSIIVGAGDYDVETKVGDINLKSLLAFLKIPVSGIPELDGTLVKLAGGTQPTLLGQDTVDWLMNHTHPTGVGVSGPPTEAAQAVALLSAKCFNG